MTNTPAPTDSDPDLFDLAAQIIGCDPVQLLKVRRDGAQLVVILATGQKFTFDPQSVGADILNQVTNALAQLTPPALPDPEPDPAPAAAPTVGADLRVRPAPKAKKAA